MAKSIKQHIINKGNEFVCGCKQNSDNSIKEAFFEDNVLYTHDCHPIDANNMQLICRNCLKLFHPTYYNDILIEKQLNEYRETLPKSNRERMLINRQRAINRAKKNTKKNVIELPKSDVKLLTWNGNESSVAKSKPIKKKTTKKPIVKKAAAKKPIAKSIEKESPKKPLLKGKAKFNQKPVIEKKKAKKPFNPIKLSKKDKIIELTPQMEIDAAIEDTLMEDAFITITDQLGLVRGFKNDWMIVWLTDNGSTESMSNWLSYEKAMEQAKSLAA